MANMNLSLPDTMKTWVEQQASNGRYSSTSDYVQDLIRRDQSQTDKLARMQTLVDEGRASGIGNRSMEELKQTARRLVQEAGKQTRHDLATHSQS